MKTTVFPFQPASSSCFPDADCPQAGLGNFRTAGTGRVVPRQIHLTPDRVIRLDRDSRVSGILVESGAVWVTETPATSDIVVREGGYLPLRGGWPVILQGLTEGIVVLSQGAAEE